MAAKTPSKVYTGNLGHLKLTVAQFTDIDDNDTWASGIDGVMDYWTGAKTDAAILNIDSESSGTFTFATNGGSNAVGSVFILSAYA